MDLKGSKTEENLYRTFAGESRASIRYLLYAERAKAEGFQWVASIFDEISDNELAHARRVYANFLKLVGNTKENLLEAIAGETDEYTDVYKNFQKIAEEEGFKEIATFYKELQEVEESHTNKYKKLYEKLENKTMFKGTVDSKWVCMNCGYIHEGTDAPVICPLCKFPQAYFKPLCDI